MRGAADLKRRQAIEAGNKTIYTVARQAGLSPATVSRVLNNRSGVNAATAQRVQAIIDETGFRPRWKAHANRSVGVLVSPDSGLFSSPYGSTLMSAILQALFAKGFTVTIIPVQQIDDSIRSFGALLTSYQIDGALVMASISTYGISEQLQVHGFPHVSIGSEHLPAMVHRMGSNDFQAGEKAATYLWRMGHRLFGLVSASLDDEGHRQRIAGFRSMLRQLDRNVTELWLHSCLEANTMTGQSVAMEMLAGTDRPTAVLVTNGQLTIGFARGCRRMGLSIPHDISLLGFEDNDEQLLNMDPPTTAMRQPTRELGRRAVLLLLQQIAERDDSSSRFQNSSVDPGECITDDLLEMSLIVRDSVAAPPGAT